MSDTITKTLPAKIKTKNEGIFYKEVQQTTINDRGNTTTKIIDRVYIIRYKDNGKDKLVTLGKKSEGIREAYCKTKRNEFITLANNGELPPQLQRKIKKDAVTLDDIADVYFDDMDGVNKANKKQKGRYELHIKKVLGSKDINTITKDDVKKLQTKLKANKAPKTVNAITTLLRSIVNYSIKEKDMNIINPATGIKNLKTDDARERFLSVEEVKLLLDDVKDDVVLYSFVKMALSTGARLESVLNIKKKDIDTVHNKITIKDLKNGSTYAGFFSDDQLKAEVAKTISKLKANDKYIPTPSRTIQRRLKPILDRLFNNGLGVRDAKNRVVIHTLRHTFASQLVIAGVPLYTVKTLMNHTKIEMTERYAKLAPDAGMDVVKGLYQ